MESKKVGKATESAKDVVLEYIYIIFSFIFILGLVVR